MKSIYLDYAAATPLDNRVLQTMKPYFATKFYNPSSIYLASKSVATDVENARKVIAGWLGAKPSEVIFTAGGTESDNLAIKGIMDQFRGANMLVSAIEHEAVLKPANQYKHKIIPVNSGGIVDLIAIKKLIDDKTILISVMYANNEVGSIQPLRKIKTVIENILAQRRISGNKLPLYFHTDACQAAAYLDLHVNQLGVDLMTVGGGKIYGPKQSGILFKASTVVLNPQILGGGQERGLRSGTENVASIVGLAKALDLVQARRTKEVPRLEALQTRAIDLIKEVLPDAVINGTMKTRLPNNIHLTVPGQDNERLIMMLDEKGVQVAAGSACSASSELPSHVLKAMGLSDKDAQSSIRLTMGLQTTQKDIIYAVKTLAKSVH